MDYTKKFEQTSIVTIKPHELDPVKEYIKIKILAKIDSCTEKYGYVTDINNIRILSNIISRISGVCIFNVKYDLITLKPESGHVYTCNVNWIYKEGGIFVEYNNINILIPYAYLTDWKYKNNYYFKDDRKISVGDWVKVRIITVKYENHTYPCIGTII